jgi:hypothetical protein
MTDLTGRAAAGGPGAHGASAPKPPVAAGAPVPGGPRPSSGAVA